MNFWLWCAPTMTIIDSCIIIDVLSNDSFTEPSKIAMVNQAKTTRLYAPDIVFSEVCCAFHDLSDVQEIFQELDIHMVHLNQEELFLAASGFIKFLKRNRKTKKQQLRSQKRILPDFYVGALASSQGIPLLTRDTKRKWKLDFPNIQIITP